MFNNFFRKSCRLRDNVEKYNSAREATDDNIIRRMRIAFFISTATDTHSEYVTLFALPRQQQLSGRASILRYTYIACLALAERIKKHIKFESETLKRTGYVEDKCK